MAGERFGLSPQTTQISTGDPRTVNEGEIFRESPGLPSPGVAPGVLGAIVRFDGNLYRYCLHNEGAGAVATVAGGVAHWFALDPETGLYTVTSDQTNSLGTINAVAGVYGSVITNGNFCYVQVGGVVTANTAASTVAGDLCIGSTTDLGFGRIASGVAPTGVVYGKAIAARVSNQNPMILSNLDW
jgi:hypothetical protein